MKTLLITIFIVLLCIDFNVLNAQTLTQITAIEKAITEEMKVAGIPGVALAIINDNQVVYEKSFGLANLQTNPENRFPGTRNTFDLIHRFR